ncbi:nitroreductase/quinone reductase family protein [Streptacidiphilus monticola]|jgi:deazaflavin-dependent oxidoreductase (nitroreductase family)|uniref:Nitroreductase/quinone reductase family protein n=1 Tax=Streptacidiphilus monticola TaxID=2161674 RepID=A0ABW1G7F4_9ACTN
MPTQEERRAWNEQVIQEFRENGGRVGGAFAGTPLLLLTTTGARSGEPRTNPLACRREGEDLVVFGSNGGRTTDPAWVHNLRAKPEAEVEYGTARFPVLARFAEGEERRRLWQAQVHDAPGFAGYATSAAPREIPVVVLTRI